MANDDKKIWVTLDDTCMLDNITIINSQIGIGIYPIDKQIHIRLQREDLILLRDAIDKVLGDKDGKS